MTCANRLKTSRPTIRTQRLMIDDTPMTISAIITVSKVPTKQKQNKHLADNRTDT